MRDFGCGKPHWSPYYVEPAYTHESRAIKGDKTSMAMTIPRAGESGHTSRVTTPSLQIPLPSSRGSQRSSRNNIMENPSEMNSTKYGQNSSRSNRSVPMSARSTLSQREKILKEAKSKKEASRIEGLLDTKQREILELKEQLARTRS